MGKFMHGLVQCAKVFVATSSDKGVGAFAACNMSEGEIVERGMGHWLRVLDLLQLL